MPCCLAQGRKGQEKGRSQSSICNNFMRTHGLFLTSSGWVQYCISQILICCFLERRVGGMWTTNCPWRTWSRLLHRMSQTSMVWWVHYSWDVMEVSKPMVRRLRRSETTFEMFAATTKTKSSYYPGFLLMICNAFSESFLEMMAWSKTGCLIWTHRILNRSM